MVKNTPPKSEKRQRGFQVPVRLDAAELERLDAKCNQAGLSRAGFLRKCVTGRAGVRSKRKPSFNLRAIEQLTGALEAVNLSNTRIGTNLNQIALQLNSEGLPDHSGELADLLKNTQIVIAECLESIEAGKPAIGDTYQFLREALGYDN